MSRRVFTREFKLAAVKLIIEDEMDVKEVGKQLELVRRKANYFMDRLICNYFKSYQSDQRSRV